MKRISIETESDEIQPFREELIAGPFKITLSEFSDKKVWMDIRPMGMSRPAGGITSNELDLLIAALQDARASIR